MQNPSSSWIHVDETARDLLARVLTERPPLLLPPLHRVPLRAGNVVEITGPSPSAKSQILLQAAMNCVLPKEWKGVWYGGMEKMVMYFDLDCRFDVVALADALKRRIAEVSGSAQGSNLRKHEPADVHISPHDDELLLACLRRFLYIRCYNSFEFLSALKTVQSQLEKESSVHGSGIHFLMIDSIGAFHWIDRAYQPASQLEDKRKNISLQSLTESLVSEIRNLLKVHPLLVLATKATMYGSGSSEVSSAFEKSITEDLTDSLTSCKARGNLMYREYMPLVWQTFVTQRIHLGILDEHESRIAPIYTSEWVQPCLNILDKFTVRENGIFMISR